MDNTTSEEWLNAYLRELETAANQQDGWLYEDADGQPLGVAGLGTLGIAATVLATNLAAVAGDKEATLATVSKHYRYTVQQLGEHAWTDVLYGALINLTQLYLGPAYLVTDTTTVDVRGVARSMWQAMEDAAASAGE